jgi:hypothetical protein
VNNDTHGAQQRGGGREAKASQSRNVNKGLRNETNKQERGEGCLARRSTTRTGTRVHKEMLRSDATLRYCTYTEADFRVVCGELDDERPVRGAGLEALGAVRSVAREPVRVKHRRETHVLRIACIHPDRHAKRMHATK